MERSFGGGGMSRKCWFHLKQSIKRHVDSKGIFVLEPFTILLVNLYFLGTYFLLNFVFFVCLFVFFFFTDYSYTKYEKIEIERMMRGLYFQPSKMYFNRYWVVMKAALVQVMNLICFVEYFEPTYICKVKGHRGYFHNPDTWAAYIYLSKDLAIDDIRGKFYKTKVKLIIFKLFFCIFYFFYAVILFVAFPVSMPH